MKCLLFEGHGPWAVCTFSFYFGYPAPLAWWACSMGRFGPGLGRGPPCECLGGCAWALVGTASLAPSQVGVLPLLWPSHGACFRHSAAAQGSFDVIKIRFRKLSEGMMTVASFQKAIRKHDDCGFGQAPSQLFLRRLCRRV
jgi:hypothetical protein